MKSSFKCLIWLPKLIRVFRETEFEIYRNYMLILMTNSKGLRLGTDFICFHYMKGDLLGAATLEQIFDHLQR